MLDTKPKVPSELEEYFLPVDVDLSDAKKDINGAAPGSDNEEGIRYRPAMYIQAQISYYSQKYKIEAERTFSSLILENEGRIIRWDEHPWKSYALNSLLNKALPHTTFEHLPDWLDELGSLKTIKTDYVDWLYRTGTLQIKTNEPLKTYASPDTSKAEFMKQCTQAAKDLISDETDALESKYDKKMDALMSKIKRQQLEVEEQEDEVDQRRLEELGTHGELLISLLGKRKRSISSSLTKRRMTSQAKADIEQEIQELETLEKQLQDLDKEKKAAIVDLNDEWGDAVNDVTQIPLKPYKKDIAIETYCILWMPYYVIDENGKSNLVAAYSK